MKIPAFLAIVCFGLSAFAQAPSNRDQVQKQLLAIEDAIAVANNKCDYDYFRQIEAEEFLFTDAQGNVSTRTEDLAGEKDCKPRDVSRAVDEPRLILSGNTAVLSARSTISVEREGKPFKVQTRFTDVFLWRDNRWQLIAGHSSRIPTRN